MTRRDRCFPPISRRDSGTLILGSLPGRRSLELHQYYAHPQNAFWKLMAAIFETEPTSNYSSRKRLLIHNRIALWDVLAGAERPGSLDGSIVHATAEANDFREFFLTHPKLRRVFFNGRKSEELFRKRVLPRIAADPTHPVCVPAIDQPGACRDVVREEARAMARDPIAD